MTTPVCVIGAGAGFAGDRVDPIRLAAELDNLLKADRSLGAFAVVEWTQRWLQDLAQASCGLAPRYYAHQKTILLGLAARSSFQRISSCARKALEFKRLAHHPLNSRLFFEDFFSEYLAVFH